jgi:hypothetical protein
MVNSRTKGKRGEYWLRDWMKRISGVEYVRTPMSGALHLDFPFDVTKRGGAPSVFDSVGNEMKNTAKLNVGQWIEQIEEACDDYWGERLRHRWFVAFTKKGRHYFIVPENYFEFLLDKSKDRSSTA